MHPACRLSQQLAAQRITERLEQAGPCPARPSGQPAASPTPVVAGSSVGGSWPAGQASPPSRPSSTHTGSVDRSEVPTSKIARALILAVMVAVLPLAGLTTVAYAQASDRDTPSQQELAEQ